MKNETAKEILFNLGYNAALTVFGAPYHYLPWNERLACKIIAAAVYTATVFRIPPKR